MTEQDFEKCKRFLDYFGVDYNADVIILTDGGNSVIMNPHTQWQDFLGYSINGVAIAVAEHLNKPYKWQDDPFEDN